MPGWCKQESEKNVSSVTIGMLQGMKTEVKCPGRLLKIEKALGEIRISVGWDCGF